MRLRQPIAATRLRRAPEPAPGPPRAGAGRHLGPPGATDSRPLVSPAQHESPGRGPGTPGRCAPTDESQERLFPGIVLARLVGWGLPGHFRVTRREAPYVRIDGDGDH